MFKEMIAEGPHGPRTSLKEGFFTCQSSQWYDFLKPIGKSMQRMDEK